VDIEVCSRDASIVSGSFPEVVRDVILVSVSTVDFLYRVVDDGRVVIGKRASIPEK
jgi:hypothetical protein